MRQRSSSRLQILTNSRIVGRRQSPCLRSQHLLTTMKTTTNYLDVHEEDPRMATHSGTGLQTPQDRVPGRGGHGHQRTTLICDQLALSLRTGELGIPPNTPPGETTAEPASFTDGDPPGSATTRTSQQNVGRTNTPTVSGEVRALRFVDDHHRSMKWVMFELENKDIKVNKLTVYPAWNAHERRRDKTCHQRRDTAYVHRSQDPSQHH